MREDGASVDKIIFTTDNGYTPSGSGPDETPREGGPTLEPTETPTPEPTTEPTSEPTLEPTLEPTPEPGDWVVLTFDDFESGFGNYTDGGRDCSLYTSCTYAHQGNNAADIQDNSGISSSFYYSNTIDITMYDEIKIEFWYRGESMETGEDFQVLYSDGSTWHTIAAYAQGTDFVNGQFYQATVIISRTEYTFPANMSIKFMCDASTNYDDVYIDEIMVSARSTGPTQEPTPEPTNMPPVAADDSAVTDEDTVVSIDVLANDSDPDGDMLQIDDAGDPGNGIAVINAGTIIYTPDADFNGADTFSYTISDGRGGTDTATVTVSVTPVNDAPDAADDSASTMEDTAVSIDVLANDTDIDGDTLSIAGVGTPANGAAAISAGKITYTPDADYNGPDSFTYTVSDGNGGTDTATVSVIVSAVNDDPVAADDSASTTEDSVVSIDVLANDTDVDGDTLSIAGVGTPQTGLLLSVQGRLTTHLVRTSAAPTASSTR
jgi:hypothetical protein